MATKAKTETTVDEANPKTAAAAGKDDDAVVEAHSTPSRPVGECVVDDGTPHTGRAVNGLVCSAHAMRYHRDGTRR